MTWICKNIYITYNPPPWRPRGSPQSGQEKQQDSSTLPGLQASSLVRRGGVACASSSKKLRREQHFNISTFVLLVFFYHNIHSFDVHFRWIFSENRTQEKEKKKLCHHHIIFMVCTVLSNIALDQSAHEKSLRYGKNGIFPCWVNKGHEKSLAKAPHAYMKYTFGYACSLLINTKATKHTLQIVHV